MKYLIIPIYFAMLHVLLFIVYTMPCLILLDLIVLFKYNGHKVEHFHTNFQALLEEEFQQFS
jgi:hypothetical protein